MNGQTREQNCAGFLGGNFSGQTKSEQRNVHSSSQHVQHADGLLGHDATDALCARAGELYSQYATVIVHLHIARSTTGTTYRYTWGAKKFLKFLTSCRDSPLSPMSGKIDNLWMSIFLTKYSPATLATDNHHQPSRDLV